MLITRISKEIVLYLAFLENPRQDCGAENFADVIQSLGFDLDRIVELTDNKRYVLTRQFR